MMRRFPSRLIALMIGVSIIGCAPAQDGGAEVLTRLFGDLEGHRFDAAADLVRDADGAPLSASTRDRFVRGWRKAYEGYDIHFTKVVLHRYGGSPSEQIPGEQIGRAGAVLGHVYDVKLEGTSNSPCVPVNSNVIPGTTHPIALKRADGVWFLLADSLVGFVDTCPGG
jgi:hypothetical protein